VFAQKSERINELESASSSLWMKRVTIETQRSDSSVQSQKKETMFIVNRLIVNGK
jgi:hypothetical protein